MSKTELTENPKFSQAIDPLLLEEVVDILFHRFKTHVQIKSVCVLSAPSRRNLILRIIFQNPSNGSPKSLILKQSVRDTHLEDTQEIFDRFAKDWAGLEFASGLPSKIPLTPLFYGGSQKSRFILIEDLGEIHTSLVDSLTGNMKADAMAALSRYVRVLSQFHGLGTRAVKDYTINLQKLNPEALLWQEDLEEMYVKISTVLEKFHRPVSSDLKNEIYSVFKTVKDPGPFTTLMHGDICPDNVFDNPSRNDMRIIDFEWGFVGNALLDGVYLRMCMPTCWCAKVFPENVIEFFDHAYRKELMNHIPEAANTAFYHESYSAACAYWILGRIANLEDILEKENDLSDPIYAELHPNWKPEDNQQRPRALYRLHAFILVSEKYGFFPHLRSMAQEILKELKDRWKDIPLLDLFPAFQ